MRVCGARDNNTNTRLDRASASQKRPFICVVHATIADNNRELQLAAQHFWGCCKSVFEQAEHSSKGRTVPAPPNGRRSTTATCKLPNAAPSFLTDDPGARTHPPGTLVNIAIFLFPAGAAGLGTLDMRSLVRKGEGGLAGRVLDATGAT
jgi:hypothetical protein